LLDLAKFGPMLFPLPPILGHAIRGFTHFGKTLLEQTIVCRRRNLNAEHLRSACLWRTVAKGGYPLFHCFVDRLGQQRRRQQ
jgi:hypothetical protein